MAERHLACIAFTAPGQRLAEHVARGLARGEGIAGGSESERWAVSVACGFGPGKVDLAQWTRESFAAADALLFVGAAGIAVRAIAPYVRSKTSDPAVLVMDVGGTWVIPLLSGHIGGANRLAQRIAGLSGARPVLTTATDVRGLWAVDDWATGCGLVIANPGAIKAISSKLLAGDTVRVRSDVAFSDSPPAQVELVDAFRDAAGDRGPDVLISAFAPASDGHGTFLRLIPRVVRVGIGCRRGVAQEQVEAAWRVALDTLVERGVGFLDERAVLGVYSIDLKAHEPGLLAFCVRHGWPLTTHSADELAAVEGDFSGSPFVREVTGVDNVCERAARLGGARPLLSKLVHDGVTIALACDDITLAFGGSLPGGAAASSGLPAAPGPA